MPELPDVECIRSYLEHTCVGAKIALSQLVREDIVGSVGSPRGKRSAEKSTTPKVALLDSSTLVGVERKGKQLGLIADNGRALLIRLGMSGQLLVVESVDKNLSHVHAVWSLRFNNTLKFLLFRDPRRFGSILPCRNRAGIDDHWNKLGPDALTISQPILWQIMKNRVTGVKALLLDQARICGLGNIYVDESLFLSGIHPKKQACFLNDVELQLLAYSIRRVLSKAIHAGGSTLRDYRTPDGAEGNFQKAHSVYGRIGLLCTMCKATIVGDIVGGRTTAFCPNCQAL